MPGVPSCSLSKKVSLQKTEKSFFTPNFVFYVSVHDKHKDQMPYAYYVVERIIHWNGIRVTHLLNNVLC